MALFYQIINIIWLSLGLMSGLLGVYFIKKEPRQIRNGIFLFISIVGITVGSLNLYSPNHYYSDGTVVFGDGSDITFLIFLSIVLIVFLGSIGLCVNGIKVIRKEGYSLTHVLPLFFGIAGILWPFLLIVLLVGAIHAGLYFILMRIAFFIVLYIPIMLVIFLLYAFVYRGLPKNKKVDFILVLGAGLKDGLVVTPLLKGRLNKGIKLYKESKGKPCIIVSGGQGADEHVSEAFAMEDYLLNQDIPKEKIIKEEYSKNTYENMLFSKKIMMEKNLNYNCLL